MKVIAFIVLTLFLGKGCSEEVENDLNTAKIEYSANSKGYYERITIQNQEVFVTHNRKSSDKGEAKKISSKDWKELVGYFKTIDLDSLSTYEDPTQKRFYDGAPIAELNINYKGKRYESRSFDHGVPPVEIEKLVNKVVSLGKKEE